MKNPLCLLFFLSLLTPAAHAQLTLDKISADTFRIQKFPLRYFFHEEKIRKPKQLESILLSKNDQQINRDWKSAKTIRAVGTTVTVLGVIMEGVGLILAVKGSQGSAGIMLGGAGVMLGGVIVGIFSNSPTQRAVTRFNGLQSGRIKP